MNSRRSWVWCAVSTLFIVAVTSAVIAEDPRVVVVTEGAELLIADLEHLCVHLARNADAWESNVLPNVEVRLIGADRTKPMRYDQILGGRERCRTQLMIPIDKLDRFITNTVVPMGISVRQHEKDKGLYSLSGRTYNGWMRVSAGYAIFADGDHLDDVPANVAPPNDSHLELLEPGYDIAAVLDNRKTTREQRSVVFADYRDSVLATVQMRPDETQEAFALRRKNSERSLEMIKRLFVESSRVMMGVTIDAVENIGTWKFVLAPSPGTSLAETLKRQAQQPSRFAGLAKPKDPVLTARLNYAFSQMSAHKYAEIYKLMKSFLAQQAERPEGLTEDQKEVRKEIVSIVFDMLTTNLTFGRWDGLAQITSHAGGKHTGLIAIRVIDSVPATKVLQLLPAADDTYDTELNVDSSGNVTIHKLTIKEYPPAFQEFFGPAGELFIGTGLDSIWVSIGDGAVEAIKEGVAAAANAPEGDVDPTVGSLDLDVLPVLQLMNRLRKEGNFDLMASLTSLGIIAEPPPAEEDFNEDDRAPTSLFQDYEWRDVAIESLDGKADGLHFELNRVDDQLEGELSIESGILKAMGAVIADFAIKQLE